MSSDTALSETAPLLQEGNKVVLSDNGCSCASICNPQSALHRYIFLVFLCLIGFGDYFCNDNPAALQEHMLKDLNISETEYMGFYSAPQWTGIVACLLGGFLIDKIFGNRLGVVLFSSLLTVSHSVFAVGALLNMYWVMYMARAIWGIFEGPMGLAVQNIAVMWFKSKELNMVFGLKTSIARAGSVLNMNVMEPIYVYVGQHFRDHTCLGVTLFAGVAICAISSVSAVIVVCFEKRADRILQKPHSTQKSEGIKISDVWTFPVTFWLITLTTATYYLAVFPFVGLGLVYFELKYKSDPQVAGNINGLVYLMGAITMPVFGLLIDRLGKSIIWMFFGIGISLASHAMLAFSFINPYVPMVMLGIGYSVTTAAMWPMAAFVVNQEHLGTAYGIMNAICAVGQTAITYLAGYLVDTRGYLVLEVFFLTCMCGALIFAALLFVIDGAKDGILNLNAKDRSVYTEATFRNTESMADESQTTTADTCEISTNTKEDIHS